jgi:arylsulfatase A-like enzyme
MPEVPGNGDTKETVSHLQIAPTICKLLGIPAPQTMKAVALI